MKIGIPKEIKNHEYRVGATPAMVLELAKEGHVVLVQKDAGSMIGFADKDYEAAGAAIVSTAREVYEAELIIKVKELQENEFELLREGQILFCYLHLAPDPEQTKHLIEKKVIAIAYETVTDHRNRLPLLVPMSEIAGRISIQVGANCLKMHQGGKGLLLGGVPGVAPAHVVVLGGGVVGTEAARMALGLGARVTVIDKSLQRLRELDSEFWPGLVTLYSTTQAIEETTQTADLLIGAILIPGKLAPKLITRKMIQKMTPGSVLVDVAIDQGGCSETSKPTTHGAPTYVVDGVVHYCVTNMPGSVARTSTLALTNATLDYVLMIANKGWRLALLESKGLMNGLNVALGKVTNPSVAFDLGYEYVPPEELL